MRRLAANQKFTKAIHKLGKVIGLYADATSDMELTLLKKISPEIAGNARVRAVITFLHRLQSESVPVA